MGDKPAKIARFNRNVNLLGLHIARGCDTPNFYFYYLFNFDIEYPRERMPHADRPLLSEQGRILLFRTADAAISGFQLRAHGLLTEAPAPLEPTATIDVAAMLDILAFEDADRDHIVIDALNLGFDCLTAVGCELENESRHILHCLADHLTFQPKFKGFLEDFEVESAALLRYVFEMLLQLARHSEIVES